MKQIKIKYLTLLFLGIGLSGLRAQQAIPASGSDATGSGGSASYSVGQMVYTTNTGTNGSVAQGVQQPYEISVVTGINETKGITLQCSAFPNPTNDLLSLKIDVSATSGSQPINYQLYDNNGKLLVKNILENNETTISMKSFVPSTYFLKVIQGNKEVKTFKIIKN
jgi:hypothetical protein